MRVVVSSTRSGLGVVLSVAALASACADANSTVSTGPSPSKCQVTLTGTSTLESAAGGGFVTVTTQPECVWTASSSTPWITGLTPATGQGSGRVDYRVSANANIAARDGEIAVNDGRVQVTQQAAAAPCAHSLAPETQLIAASGGTGSVTVTTSSGCEWSATSSTTWLTMSAPTTGTATGTITFTVAANAGAERTATVTVAGQQATVRQSGTQATPCTYELTPAGQSFTAAGGPGPLVTVTTSTGCQWTARTADTWISLSGGASGTGPGTVPFTVAANTGAARTGTITIAGATFTVSQAAPVPPTCSFAIAPTSQSIAAAGGAGSPIAVTAGNGCSWTAASNVGWITVTSDATGSGSGHVTFTVAANPALTARSGTLTVAGHTFTVNQAAIACSFTLDPGARNHDYPALNNQTITVNASDPACTWTATSNESWIGIVPGTNSGAGHGIVTYNLAHNPGDTRAGTLTIGGQTFTVYQAAQPPCTYTLTPMSATLPAGAAAGLTVRVTTNISTCGWSASTSSTDDWLTITSGESGTGQGTVTYSVAANGNPTPRSGALTIAGQTFTVAQGASPCAFTINPTSANLPAGATANQVVTVTTNFPSCAWTATASEPTWLGITAGTFGTGNGRVTYGVTANTTAGPRIGQLAINGQTVTVTQARCTFTIAPTTVTLPGSGGSGSVQVTANGSHCSWNATSNNAPWLTITNGTGGVVTATGSGVVNYTVVANAPTPRLGTLTVAGFTFTVNQAGN